MQLGLTWPLQRLLHQAVPYGEPVSRLICWDLHCITLHGRSSLLLVHCASRHTCVRFDMTSADWADLPRLALEEIRLGLLDAGLDELADNRHRHRFVTLRQQRIRLLVLDVLRKNEITQLPF